jgi:hypothetical protein
MTISIGMTARRKAAPAASRCGPPWLTGRHRDAANARGVPAESLKFEAYLKSIEFKGIG